MNRFRGRSGGFVRSTIFSTLRSAVLGLRAPSSSSPPQPTRPAPVRTATKS